MDDGVDHDLAFGDFVGNPIRKARQQEASDTESFRHLRPERPRVRGLADQGEGPIKLIKKVSSKAFLTRFVPVGSRLSLRIGFGVGADGAQEEEEDFGPNFLAAVRGVIRGEGTAG